MDTITGPPTRTDTEPIDVRVGHGRSVLLRVVAANAAVFGLAALVLAVSPLEVSSPVTESQVIFLAAGLALTLLVNSLVVRSVLRPLADLADTMRAIDPLRPGVRIELQSSTREVEDLASAYNGMLERVEFERRDSARRAQAAQERERRNISLELHDDVGQTLTALLLQMDVAIRTAPPELREPLEAARDAARASLNRVRSIVQGLRPEALDDLGLQRALRYLCDQIERSSRLPVRLEIDSRLPPLTSDAQLVVYRVAQESLTNVVRHAVATHVLVRLERDSGGGVRLTVIDDGTGVPVRARASSGVRGMRERALLIGARLEIQTGQKGATVTLGVPEAEVEQ